MFQSKISIGNLKNNLFIITVIVLSAALLRFSLVLTKYQHPTGEEAIYGLMGAILENRFIYTRKIENFGQWHDNLYIFLKQ